MLRLKRLRRVTFKRSIPKRKSQMSRKEEDHNLMQSQSHRIKLLLIRV